MEVALLCADWSRAVCVSFGLFYFPEGPRRGLPALRVTISRWIRDLFVHDYFVKGKPFLSL